MRIKNFAGFAAVAAMVIALVLTASGCGSSEPESRPYDYNLEEYVQVGEYMGLEYTGFQVEVTDEELQAAVDELMASFAEEREVTEGTIQKGDYVKIKYTMEVAGEKIEGTDQQSYTVKVGESGLMEDVDKALVGVKVGETVAVETAFAEDYDLNEEFAGKSVTYEILVESIIIPVYPELTDDFAKENLGVDSAEKYLQLLKESMYETQLSDAVYAAGEEIWAEVVANSQVLQYPQAEVDAIQEVLTENFLLICQQYGMEFETALSEVLQMSEEEFDAEMYRSAEETVKEELVLYTIARENDLEFSEKEIQDYLDLMLDSNGITEEEFEAEYGMDIREYAEDSGIVISMLYNEVFDFLVEKGVEK